MGIHSLIVKRYDELKQALWQASHPIAYTNLTGPEAKLQADLIEFATGSLQFLQEACEDARQEVLGVGHRRPVKKENKQL